MTMVSRVAESSFWLHRHVERAESMARLVSVNHFTVLDAEIHGAERWRPVVTVAGEEARFTQVCGEAAFNDDDVAEHYLTWEDKNPVSIKSCIAWARENARTIREVISREMWELVNVCWQWLNSDAAQTAYQTDRAAFYQQIRSVAAEFQGVCHSTLLHEQPFDFMRLGMLLERASQTARVMDVKHHWLSGAATHHIESPQEAAQWAALLRLCAASEPFFKRFRTAPAGPRVATFLLKDPAFPRSVLHCLDRSKNFIRRIQKEAGREDTAALRLVESSLKRLEQASIQDIFAAGIHEELTQLINTAAQVCNLLHQEFFDPGPAQIMRAG